MKRLKLYLDEEELDYFQNKLPPVNDFAYEVCVCGEELADWFDITKRGLLPKVIWIGTSAKETDGAYKCTIPMKSSTSLQAVDSQGRLRMVMLSKEFADYLRNLYGNKKFWLWVEV